MWASTSVAHRGTAATLVGSISPNARVSTPTARSDSPRSRWVAASGSAASTSPSRPLEKLFGLLEAALSNPQLGQAHEGTRTKRAVSETPDPHGVAQRRVGFAPSAGRGEQPAVVRATERCHGRQLSTRRDVLTDPDPLIGPVHIVRVLARREELAEDLLDDREVIDIASRHCRQGLVEEQHALRRRGRRGRGSRRDTRAWRTRATSRPTRVRERGRLGSAVP